MDFKGDKIRSTPSFGGEVKPLVPCRRFTACKKPYRKYKESAHVAYLENMISQPTFEMSPIWLPIIKEEIKRIQENGSLS
jgi:hypothetical protein